MANTPAGHGTPKRRSLIVGGLAGVAATATAVLASPASASTPASISASADSQAVTDADKQAVLATMQALLDGIANRDKDAMRATMLATGTAVHTRDGVVTVQTLGDLPDSMPGGTTQMSEPVHDVEVRIEQDVAMAWAPYEFLYDGVVDHVGTNIFSFVKQPDGTWLISGITDSGRTP